MLNIKLPEYKTRSHLSRRDFIRFTGAGLTSLIFATACGGLSKLTPTPRGETSQPADITKQPIITSTPTPTDTPTKEPTPSPTSTPTPTETPTPTATKEPTPTKTPLPRYINEGQWNGLTPEQQDYAINQWAAKLSRDQAIRDAQVLEKALPYLKMFAHEQDYPMDPDVSNIVDQIIAERGSLPWAVDWRNMDYERGFFYVRTINNGRTQAASNIDAFIQITSSGIYIPGSFPSHCSPEAQRIITNLEFAGAILKEGGEADCFGT